VLSRISDATPWSGCIHQYMSGLQSALTKVQCPCQGMPAICSLSRAQACLSSDASCIEGQQKRFSCGVEQVLMTLACLQKRREKSMPCSNHTRSLLKRQFGAAGLQLAESGTIQWQGRPNCVAGRVPACSIQGSKTTCTATFRLSCYTVCHVDQLACCHACIGLLNCAPYGGLQCPIQLPVLVCQVVHL